MAIDKNFYGAGLAHGSIKLADGNVYDIDAIVSAEGDPQVDDVPVKGDDEMKATFYFNQREEITLSANGLSFDVIQAITGNSYSSSAGGIEVALGTASEMNPPYCEVKAQTVGKDKIAGAAVTIEKIWHKVAFGPAKVTQQGEKEYAIEMTGVAYQTSLDIEGAALASKRVATIHVAY